MTGEVVGGKGIISPPEPVVFVSRNVTSSAAVMASSAGASGVEAAIDSSMSQRGSSRRVR